MRAPGAMGAWVAMRALALAAFVSIGVLPGAALASDRYVVIVSGAAGSPDLAEQHAAWRLALVTTLRDKMQLPADHLIVLTDKATSTSGAGESAAGPGVPGGPGGPGRTVTATPTPAAANAQPDAKADAKTEMAARLAEIDAQAQSATRDNVRATLTRLARDMKRDDVVMVVLFGHSTFDGVDAKFNLVGPDLEAAEWERLVTAIPGRVVFVNTTAASAPFMKRLAGPGRVVITATDNPAQRYQTVFPEFFAQAFDAKDVDLDKDGRVSIWEAFAYASTQVKLYYRQRGQLSVERPVLDDTGDGVGKEAGETGADGAIASRTFLDASDDPGSGAGPALSELINRRNVLEQEFEDLKRRRGFMPAGDYEKQRDILLIDIARISHEIRLEQRKRS